MNTATPTKITNVTLDSLKPRATVYRYPLGDGLLLVVRPATVKRPGGLKTFYYRYEIGGIENMFRIGEYPAEVKLADARLIRADNAKLVAQGIHPRAFKVAQIRDRIESDMNTFGALAAAYLPTKERTEKNPGGVSNHYYKQIRTALDVDILPALGDLPLDKVTAARILPVLEARAETPAWAKLVRRVVSEVFTYGIMKQRVESDPTYALRNVISTTGLIKPKPRKANAHLTINVVPEFLAAIDDAPATEWDRERKLGTKLLLLTMVRPNELAGASWAEFDLDAEAPMWAIPAARMKMRRSHLVPLSRQAVALLRELHTLTGDTPVLFPEREARKRTGENVTRWPQMFARFIRAIGFGGRLTAHGCRATASTYLNGLRVQVGAVKVKRFEKDTIELQLAHAPRDMAGFYDHSARLDERTEMMQFYADAVMPPKVAELRLVA